MKRAVLLVALIACDSSSGGAWEPQTVLELDDEGSLDGLAADEDALYWVVHDGEYAHDIWRQVGDAAPVRLGGASGDSTMSSFEVSQHHVVFTVADIDGCTTGAYPLDGGEAVQLGLDDWSGRCGGLSADRDIVAWSNTYGFAEGAHVFRDDLGDVGAAAELWRGDSVGVTAVDGGSTYWIGDGAIWRHDDAAVQLYAPAAYLAIRGDSLLWESEGELRESSLASFDGDGAVLATGLGLIRDLDADASYVYVVADGALLAIPRAGGEAVEIAADADGYIDGLAARDGGVYFGVTVDLHPAILFASP